MIISLGEEKDNLSDFRTFVRFALVWFLFVGVWEGLRFVIVALPGLFSYFFFVLICFLASFGRSSLWFLKSVCLALVVSQLEMLKQSGIGLISITCLNFGS